jgi:hypothetical protein
MARDFALVAICGTGMAFVAIDNVADRRDPIPAAVAGMVFTGGIVLVENINEDLATALAVLYLVSVLLTRSNSVTNFFVSIAGGGGSADKAPAKKTASRPVPKNR